MTKTHQYYVYVLTNKANAVLYTSVTSDLKERTWKHKQGENEGFTKKYGCNKLVYYEEYSWIQDAIEREKKIKGGSRQAKIDVINLNNPEWKDLSEDWYD